MNCSWEQTSLNSDCSEGDDRVRRCKTCLTGGSFLLCKSLSVASVGSGAWVLPGWITDSNRRLTYEESVATSQFPESVWAFTRSSFKGQTTQELMSGSLVNSLANKGQVRQSLPSDWWFWEFRSKIDGNLMSVSTGLKCSRCFSP